MPDQAGAKHEGSAEPTASGAPAKEEVDYGADPDEDGEDERPPSLDGEDEDESMGRGGGNAAGCEEEGDDAGDPEDPLADLLAFNER